MTRYLVLILLMSCASKQIITDKKSYQESVSQTINDSKKDITSCEEIYAKNQDFDKTPQSDVKIDLFIKSDGTVFNAILVDKDITHDDVKDCMLRKINKIKFAKHGLGEETEVRTVLTIKKLTHNHKGRNAKAFWP